MNRMTLAISTSFMLLGTSIASAQTICGPHEEITKRLETGYQEATKGFGILGNGGLVELFVSDKGTWSFVLTRPDGIACLMAAGKNWEKLEIPKPVSEEFS